MQQKTHPKVRSLYSVSRFTYSQRFLFYSFFVIVIRTSEDQATIFPDAGPLVLIFDAVEIVPRDMEGHFRPISHQHGQFLHIVLGQPLFHNLIWIHIPSDTRQPS